MGIPGRESSAAGTKLRSQSQGSPPPRTEGLQPRPTPRFLKGSGVPRPQQPRKQQGPPQFLKGGGSRRHSKRAALILEDDTSEEDDAGEHVQQNAEVAEEPGRRRTRMRRHEHGYNEEAQVKALECTILSAGMLSPLPVTYAP